MLELHLGQQGTPSMGVTAQVPHYLVQFDFPRAASTLLGGVARATGLALPRVPIRPSDICLGDNALTAEVIA